MADEDEYVPLASPEDVAALLGRDLTPAEAIRVGPILKKASALFRMEAGREFTEGFADNVFRVVGDTITLTEKPVESVLSIKDDRTGETITGYTRTKNRIRLRDGCTSGMVRVVYTWGTDIPEIVKQTVADIARKVLSIDPRAAAGLTQYGKTTGPFSEQLTYATWAQGGQTMLAPDDRAIAQSFRTKTYGPIVQQAPTGRPSRWSQ